MAHTKQQDDFNNDRRPLMFNPGTKETIKTPAKYRNNLPVDKLYAQPTPNPFTPEYMDGYNDGYDGRESRASGNPVNYRTGYVDGTEQHFAEKISLGKTGSSNA